MLFWLGLVYFIMPVAVGEAAVWEARRTKIAPIPIAKKIEILKSGNRRVGLDGVQDVINFFWLQGIVAFNRTLTRSGFVGIGRNAWGNNESGAGRIHCLSTEAGKPVVGLLHSIAADEYLTGQSTTYRRRLPIIDPIHIQEHLFVSNDVGCVFWRPVFEWPNVRPLINLKLRPYAPNRLSGESIGFQHGAKLESVDCKDKYSNSNCRDLNSEPWVILYEFYKAHRFLLALVSFAGVLWFSGQFLIYSGRYGCFHFGKCLTSLLFAFVFAAHTIAVIALF